MANNNALLTLLLQAVNKRLTNKKGNKEVKMRFNRVS